MCQGTVLNDLLMSVASCIAWEGDCGWLKPSRNYCVQSVCSMVMEWLGLKLCCLDKSGRFD